MNSALIIFSKVLMQKRLVWSIELSIITRGIQTAVRLQLAEKIPSRRKGNLEKGQTQLSSKTAQSKFELIGDNFEKNI